MKTLIFFLGLIVGIGLTNVYYSKSRVKKHFKYEQRLSKGKYNVELIYKGDSVEWFFIHYTRGGKEEDRMIQGSNLTPN